MSDKIRFDCPQCGLFMLLPQNAVGKKVICKRCKVKSSVVAPNDSALEPERSGAADAPREATAATNEQIAPAPDSAFPPQLENRNSKLEPCSMCGKTVSKNARRCPHCSAPLPRKCKDCNVVFTSSHQSCPNCGCPAEHELAANYSNDEHRDVYGYCLLGVLGWALVDVWLRLTTLRPMDNPEREFAFHGIMVTVATTIFVYRDAAMLRAGGIGRKTPLQWATYNAFLWVVFTPLWFFKRRQYRGKDLFAAATVLTLLLVASHVFVYRLFSTAMANLQDRLNDM